MKEPTELYGFAIFTFFHPFDINDVAMIPSEYRINC